MNPNTIYVGANASRPKRAKASLFARVCEKLCRPSVIQAGAVVLDQLSYSIATFVVFALIAKSVTKTDFGILILGLQLIHLLALIQHYLIEIPFSVFSQGMSLARKKTYTGNAFYQYILLSLLQVSLLSVLLFFISISDGTDDFSPYIIPLSLILVAFNLRDFLRTVLVAGFRVWQSCLMGFTINAGLALLVVSAYVSKRLSLDLAFSSLAFCSFAPSAVVLFLHRKKLGLVKSCFFSDCVRNTKYGSWLLLGGLSDVGGLRLLPWFALMWRGPECVAAYGVVSIVSGSVRPLFKSLGRYLTPKLSEYIERNGERSAHKKIVELVIVVFGFGSIFLLLIGMFGREILQKCFTPEYEKYTNELLVMSLAVTVKAATIILQTMLTVLKKPKQVFICNFLASCVALSLAFWLVPRLGVMGVVLAFLSHRMVTFIISIIELWYPARRRPSEVVCNNGNRPIVRMN